MSSSLLLQDFVISHTRSYFNAVDLCSIEAASTKTSAGYSSCSSWLTVAKYAGLALAGIDKRSVKAVCRALHSANLTLGSGLNLQLPSKGVHELTKAAEHMQRNRREHLAAGGKSAVTFIERFFFEEEDVDSYLDDPDAIDLVLTSHPITLTVGNATFELSLNWQAKTMWLEVHSTNVSCLLHADRSFSPLVIRLRTVSDSLCLWKDFQVLKPHTMLKGDGLCCLLETPEALADNMDDGILVVGLAYDGATSQVQRRRATQGLGEMAQALQLDAPGWKNALLL